MFRKSFRTIGGLDSILVNSLLRRLLSEAPSFGKATQLHTDAPAAPAPERARQLHDVFHLRWLGTIGSILILVGALGAGALPVVNNPYLVVPGGALFSRMLHTSTAMVFVGVGFLVVAWLLLAPHVGAPLRKNEALHSISVPQLWRIWLSWVIPLVFAAPLFTQDIYSYLAQGSVVAHGMDPYAAGPVELLGADNDLARSVPFIWANSPSPYGPVALGIAAAISRVTGDSILWGVLLHRLCALLALVGAGWAITHLARRCRVQPVAALWLGLLNPLTLLHLVGGIHNESVLLGLLLVGLELGLRGKRSLFLVSGALITCAGAVKVTGFIALGFTGMALARELRTRTRWAIPIAIFVQLAILFVTLAAVTWLTGIPLGWVTGQGGAVTVRSWLSSTTAIGVGAGAIGMLLGLGDHTEAMLTLTRGAGVAVAGVFMVYMLWNTYKGRIHPVGALGVSTLVLVVLFPVVHPWYILWAVLPLSAWANRLFFRVPVVAYSAFMAFVVLPRGSSLPPSSVIVVYALTVVFLLATLAVALLYRRRSGLH